MSRAEFLEQVKGLIDILNPKKAEELSHLKGEYDAQALDGLIWFICEFLENGNSRGVNHYERNLAFRKPQEIQILAEIFAEPIGKSQTGNPSQFETFLKATPEQKIVYLQYVPAGGVWYFTTQNVYKDGEHTESITLDQMFK